MDSNMSPKAENVKTKTPPPTHILVIPYPAQGHMLSLLDLTHHLATTTANNHLTITILVTPKNLPLLTPLVTTHPKTIQSLVLPFPSTNHPCIPPGTENTKDLPNNQFLEFLYALGDLQGPLLNWFKSQPCPPDAIISDMFMGWTHELASQVRVPRLVFSPSGAKALCVINALWRDMPRYLRGVNDDEVVGFPSLPRRTEYPWWQLSSLYRRYVEGEAASEFLKDGMRANLASWGLVVNSFSDLESVYLDHLKESLGHDRVWAVGPILPADHKVRGGSSSVDVDNIMKWLDTCGDCTVVYVCFGSQAVLTNPQMEALAFGLENSGVRFLWCVKEPVKGDGRGGFGEVPLGFEDRVAGRGRVARGWVPQVSILSHKAVGAFLTHCGWNSILEGIVVASVPMLTWPMGADQFMNADLLVNELKVAMKACEGAATVPDSEKLARVLAEAMTQCRVERDQAVELRRAALDAVKDGGSSVRDFNGLIKSLGQRIKFDVNSS